MVKGDYDTPEGFIGKMNIASDWESCLHVGGQWAYGGEGGFKGPENCIRMLVSCTTGGGNLLLNFGPRPDGTFAEGEAKVARAMGEWLKKYGAAIYGTSGGPYRNGTWGGSCHKGNKLYHAAEVWVNGKSVGARLWGPYVFDVGKALLPGSNAIRVRVANLINNSYDDLQPSGLLGPVTLKQAVPAK